MYMYMYKILASICAYNYIIFTAVQYKIHVM